MSEQPPEYTPSKITCVVLAGDNTSEKARGIFLEYLKRRDLIGVGRWCIGVTQGRTGTHILFTDETAFFQHRVSEAIPYHSDVYWSDHMGGFIWDPSRYGV